MRLGPPGLRISKYKFLPVFLLNGKLYFSIRGSGHPTNYKQGSKLCETMDLESTVSESETIIRRGCPYEVHVRAATPTVAGLTEAAVADVAAKARAALFAGAEQPEILGSE